MTVRLWPVSKFVMMICARGTTAPLGSETSPVMVAVVCAKMLGATSSAAAVAKKKMTHARDLGVMVEHFAFIIPPHIILEAIKRTAGRPPRLPGETAQRVPRAHWKITRYTPAPSFLCN